MASRADREAEFTAYEKMPEDSNCWHSRKLDAVKKWIAMEKVHGANLSFSVSCGAKEVRVAKRGGYLQKGESFFGVFRQKGFLEREQEKARKLFAAVVEMDSDVSAITVYGELFGGTYSIKMSRNMITIYWIIGYYPTVICSAFGEWVLLSRAGRLFLCFQWEKKEGRITLVSQASLFFHEGAHTVGRGE